MKLSFRWFGAGDPVPLGHIRQIPGIQAVGCQVPSDETGGLLSESILYEYKKNIEQNGLEFRLFESLPVHPSIKVGSNDRDKYILLFKDNMRLLASAGVKVIVYNFRPMFRWARTEIYKKLEDGSTASEFSRKNAPFIDPFTNSAEKSEWHREHSEYVYQRQLTSDLKLNGYYTPESTALLQAKRDEYVALGKEGLWTNLEYFLSEIIPLAEELGLRMAIHPDDPPWDIFGIPRIMTGEEGADRLVSLYDSPCNGIVFCTGTFGSHPHADIPGMIDKYLKMDRIPFAHIRNIRASDDALLECAHYSEYGSLDMVRVVQAFYDNAYKGFARPDHGRMIWGEEGKPGNGIYDRALGSQYILGIWETLTKIRS